MNLDVGEPTVAGMYKMADDAYAKLIDKLAKPGFAGMPRQLRENILGFYKNDTARCSSKLQQQFELLKGAGALTEGRPD